MINEPNAGADRPASLDRIVSSASRTHPAPEPCAQGGRAEPSSGTNVDQSRRSAIRSAVSASNDPRTALPPPRAPCSVVADGSASDLCSRDLPRRLASASLQHCATAPATSRRAPVVCCASPVSTRSLRAAPLSSGDATRPLRAFFVTTLGSALATLGIAPSLESPLDNFCTLFQKWNRSINLSAARSEPELREHVIDSLHVVPHLRAVSASDNGAPVRILDVGAGGGLPAVVVAICLPDAHVTALEPVHKKHAFLRTAARELSLANLDPLAERLDHHGPRDYDAVMSRATFDLREWLLLGLTHVRAGGVVLGFEAVPRGDLPPAALRESYALDDKSRAIITLRRSDSG